MKKTFLIIVSGLLLFSVISCGDKKKSDSDKEESKASTLAELQKKYDNKKFKKCEDIISFYEEAMYVYCKTIDKAVDGDEQALEDFDAFEDYMDLFEDDLKAFTEECPDKIEKMMDKLQKKMEKYEDKIDELESSEEATTLYDLQNKYDGVEFRDCDEALAFAEESFDVYFATIDKAIEGDEQAIEDIDAFDDYFNSFDRKMEKFEDKCPEKMDAMQEELGKKFELYMPKLMQLVGMGE